MTRSCLAACLGGVLLSLFCGTAFGGRILHVEISLNGDVILEGDASDYGERDADAIWESLKEVNLRETEAFKQLKVAPTLKEYKMQYDAPKKGPRPIKIDASSGGEADTCVLTLKRIKPDANGRCWRIAADDLDDLFDFRMISRDEATRLKNPKFDKIESKVKKSR